MLGVGGMRRRAGLQADWFGLLLGSGAVVAGLGRMAGIAVPVVALLLVAGGLAIIAGQVEWGS